MSSTAQSILNHVQQIDLSWLKVPTNEKECETLEEVLEYCLDDEPKSHLVKVIGGLISEYESEKYPIPEAEPKDVLKFLMEQHGLKQVDLVDIFTNQGNVSQVLNGKRGLSLENIKGLSQRFSVSAAVFIRV